MNISTTDAKALFTKELAAIYSDQLKPKTFMRSFFTETEVATKEVSIQVMRNNENIAVDVVRGTEGNRNKWDKTTEKIIVPPYYREYFDLTQLSLYDALYAQPEISAVNFGRFIDQVAEKMNYCVDKIDRSYELQCAQVLTTGIVTLNSDTNIDFKRKSASLVDLGSSNYWADANVDPNTSLETGCKFLRETGKAAGGVVNAIMGQEAFAIYLNNTAVQNRGKIFNYALDQLVQAQRDAVGYSFHGEISVGAFRVRIFTYPEIYTDANGSNHYYVDPKKVILVPEMPKFTLTYAAVPQLLTTGILPQKGKMAFGDYIDERMTAHIYDVKSAGVAIPVAVDQIYTMKVVTG